MKDLKGLKKMEERKQRLSMILGNAWWCFDGVFECERVVTNGKIKLRKNKDGWLASFKSKEFKEI